MKTKDLLEGIIEETLAQGKWEDSLFIFPSRRAGLYFRETARRMPSVPKPLLLPPVYSLTDFIFEVTGLKQPGRLALLLRMYALFIREEGETQGFDQFHPWGGMMLNDFNDIDQNLQDPSLFEKLCNWMGSDFQEESPFQKKYRLKINEMEKAYRLFREALLQRGEAYYGLALRKLCEEKEKYLSQFEGKRVVFCAFNALSRGEWELFRYFKEKNALFFWDMDAYFTEDPLHEAGFFYQRGIKELYAPLSPPEVFDYLRSQKKKVSIYGYPGIVQQAKALGRDLAALIRKEGSAVLEKTAVILGDEGMLLPLLRSLPREVDSFNVTMGLSMKESPVFSFTESYLRLITGPFRRERQGYYVKDLHAFLLHPLSRHFYEDFSPELFLKTLRDKGRPFVAFDEIKEGLGEDLFFDEPRDAFDLYEGYKTLLKETARRLDPLALEQEFLFSLLESMGDFQSLLKELAPRMGLLEISRVLQEIASLVSVPFSGEPLKGLQVMGMLETRGLSFENIFILGVNEKQFPTGKSEQGLIPYEFRKNAGLTTYESRDAIFAYYFYRLLMRAETAVLYYNTEMDQMGKGERSRFIEQLLHEWAETNKDSVISESLNSLGASQTLFPGITISKTPEMMKRLCELTYSASAFNEYLSCPLKFYFKYIERLKEPQSLIDDPDASLFGTIIHNSMQELFKPFKGKILTENDLESIKRRLSPVIDKAYSSQLPGVEMDKGKNYINRRIMAHLIGKLLDHEKERLPFKILALEERRDVSFSHKERNLRLGGFIDRVDEKDNTIAILDYKTGQIKSLTPPKGRDPGELAFYQNRKEMVQLLFYSLLYPSSQELRPGLISFTALSNPYYWLPGKKLGEDLSKEARRMAHVVFDDILEESRPFVQTEDTKDCEYCPYRNICGR
ncbi:MAG TPA: PD-(D/E)XK nuclease family protein [Candidatus Mcinerneyibacteriales bacterium]|nr:PD-(D/E)XK nuclease family protein [Candidatus Mcinerneyibacteriales bacterium]